MLALVWKLIVTDVFNEGGPDAEKTVSYLTKGMKPSR